jgi:soluble lytic murein transglycosylase-like protein
MRRTLTALCLAAFLPYAANAADCFNGAGRDFGINPNLLRAIALHESAGRLDAVNTSNSDGSEDLCAMQINTQHLPLLSQAGITREILLSDACSCIYAGAYILAGEIRRAGQTWKAVAQYNVGPKGSMTIGAVYAGKVQRALAIIERRQNPAPAPRSPAIAVLD